MKYSVWNKIVLPVLFTIVIALGLAQGDSLVYADGQNFTFTSYKLDDTNVATSNNHGNIIYNQPVLLNSYDNDGVTNYLWETTVYINATFNFPADYYSSFHQLEFSLNYPTNSNVINTEISELDAENVSNISLYSFTKSSSAVNLKFLIGIPVAKYTRIGINGLNLLSFKMQIHTSTNTAPVINFTSTSMKLQFWKTTTDINRIKQAIDQSESAAHLAAILDIMEADTVTLSQILTQLGYTNTHLTYIQEYAYEIWNILQTHLSTQAESDFADAETKVEDIVNDMQQYNPVKPNSQQLQTDAQSRYMQLQLEEQNESIFFYLNWAYLLPILLLVFTFAILSYILYGGK